jgi:hypothetical protein
MPSPRRGAGLGLANVRSRLAQLYGERHSFEISDRDGGGTEVAILLPFAVDVAAERQSSLAEPIGAVSGQPSVVADLPTGGLRHRPDMPGDQSRQADRASS